MASEINGKNPEGINFPGMEYFTTLKREIGLVLPLNPAENGFFLEEIASFLNDKNLSEEEKIKLNEIILRYNSFRSMILGNTKTRIDLIKSMDDIMKFVEGSDEYKKALEAIKGLSSMQIENVQYCLNSKITGKFSARDFIAYKNSSFSRNDIFRDMKEFRYGRVIGKESLDSFAKKFKQLNTELGYSEEDIAIIASNIKENSFVYFNAETGNIEIYDQKGEKSSVVEYNAVPTLDSIIVHTLNDKSNSSSKKLDFFVSLLNLRKSEKQKNELITKIKDSIKTYSLYENARNIFSKTDGNKTTILLPTTSLNMQIKAIDLYSDYDNIMVNGVLYTKKGNDFINLKGNRLVIKNSGTYEIDLGLDSLNKDTENIKDLLLNPETDASIFVKILMQLDSDDKKMYYIQKLRDIITDNSLFNEARRIFTKETNKGVEMVLPQYYLDMFITAKELYGDYKNILVNNVLYTNTGEAFISSSGSKIVIRDKKIYNILLDLDKLRERISNVEGLLNNPNTDIDTIYKILIQMGSENEKREYIEKIKNVIRVNGMYERAREIFTSNVNGTLKINLPVASLVKYITANDLFGDYSLLTAGGINYTMSENGRFVSSSGRKLLINNGTSIKLSGFYNKDTLRPLENGSLNEFFEYYINNAGKDLHLTRDANRCGRGMKELMLYFFKANGLNINDDMIQVHGKNWQHFFSKGATINEENPFIMKYNTDSNRLRKFTSLETLMASEKEYASEMINMFDKKIKFEKVEITDVNQIMNPKEALFMCFNGGIKSSRQNGGTYGHVEFAYTNNAGERKFISSIDADFPGGSGGLAYKNSPIKDLQTFTSYTGFTGAYRMVYNP